MRLVLVWILVVCLIRPALAARTLAADQPIAVKLELLQPTAIAFPEPRFYALGGVPTLEIAHMLVREAGVAIDVADLAARKESAFEIRLDQIVPIPRVVTHSSTSASNLTAPRSRPSPTGRPRARVLHPHRMPRPTQICILKVLFGLFRK